MKVEQPAQTSHFDSLPSSELAAGELWEEEVRDKLFKPRYRKSDLDARRAAVSLVAVMSDITAGSPRCQTPRDRSR